MAKKPKKLDIPIEGMDCASCAIDLENSFNKLEGLNEAVVDFNSNKAHLEYNPSQINIDDITKTVESLGFNILKSEATLKIKGMHCASCVLMVDKYLSNLPGVFSVHVDLTSEKALVFYDSKQVSIKEMAKAIEEAGFEYLGLESEISSADEEELFQKDLNSKRNRIVVGLIFSGILMYVMFMHVHVSFLTMGQLSLLIAIIPFMYVSYPIISTGFNSLIHKNLNMDVMYSMGILVAFVSSILGTFNIVLDSSFMFYETALMLPSFLMIGRYLEARAKKKTSSSIKQLIGLQPKTAILLKYDEDSDSYIEEEISIENISIGDILLVKPGDKIPVDGIVIDGETYIDESMINGEPLPSFKSAGMDVYAGTINQDGILKIKSTKIGKDTLLSQIIDLVEKAQSSKPPVQKIADKVVQYFIPTILTIAVVVFCVWYFIFNSTLLFALTTLISILVVACPCALGLATPTAVTVGVGRAAEYGILIKNGETLETSENVDVAVFDKTGTITEGKPEISDIILLNNDILTNEDDLVRYVASVESNSNHPIAKTIVNYANYKGINLISVSNFENITGKGLKGIIGDFDILVGNKKLLNDENINISKENLDKFDELVSLSKTTVFLVINSQIVGIISLMDKIKDSSKHTMNALSEMGIKSCMITGDNEKSAKNVAEAVGIDKVMANLLPNEKLDEVINIQKDNNVLFCGDGINDAPAISQADIGIALGSGTDIAMESGDIVLMGDDLENVVAAIQFSKKVMTRIKENIFWAFAYNCILIPVAGGVLYPFWGIMFRPELAGLAMALSSVTVISLSLMLKTYVPPIKR